jgi:hypothetical protein
MKFVVKKPRYVDDDQLAAALYYDEKERGLGDDFLNESDAVISALSQNAELYSIRFADVRCIRLKRFKPYGVYYIIRGKEVIVLAIHHGARDPQWLQQRRNRAD